MKDMMDKMVYMDQQKNTKKMQQQEMKTILDKQIKDKFLKLKKERFLTDKEFALNKPIIHKMMLGRQITEDQQQELTG